MKKKEQERVRTYELAREKSRQARAAKKLKEE